MKTSKVTTRKTRSIIVSTGLLYLAAQPAFAVTAPTFTPPTSRFITSTSPTGTASISAAAGTILYSIDGSYPTLPYNGSYVFFPYNVQINAVAVSGGVNSPVSSLFLLQNDVSFQIAAPTLWYTSLFGSAAPASIPIEPDVSGNGADATQTTVANQPTIVNNSINGEPAIGYNGTSNSFQVPSETFSATGLTLFVVADVKTSTANAQILNFSGATAPQNLIGIGESSTSTPQFTIYNSAGTSSTSVTSTTAFPTNKYQLLEVVQGDISPTTATLFVNGVQVAQNTAMNAVPALALANNFMGQSSSGSHYFNGNIAEVIMFASPQATTSRTQIEAYLLQKYAILQQTPTAPIFSSPTGTLTGPSQISISAQPNAVIHVTTDGTNPGANSPTVTSPLQVNYTQTIKAVAISNGQLSTVTSATYTLPTQFSAPASGGPALQINLTAPTIAIP